MNRPPLRRLLPLLALAVAIGVPLALRSAYDLDWSAESVGRLVDGLGIWGPIGMVLIVAFRMPLLLNTQLVLTASGAAFGFLPGASYGVIGAWICGMAIFGAIRWLGPDAAAQRVPPNLRRTLTMAGSSWAAVLMAAGTALPFGPTSLYHAAASLTPMRLPVFGIALFLGLIPRSLLYAALGSRLIQGDFDAAGWLGLAVFAPMLLFLHPRVRAWVAHQMAPSGAVTDPRDPPRSD